jgi:hypothetical protein
MSRETLCKCDICGHQSTNAYLYADASVPTSKNPLCDDAMKIEIKESSGKYEWREIDMCYSCRAALVETVLQMRKDAERKQKQKWMI